MGQNKHRSKVDSTNLTQSVLQAKMGQCLTFRLTGFRQSPKRLVVVFLKSLIHDTPGYHAVRISLATANVRPVARVWLLSLDPLCGCQVDENDPIV